MAEETATEYLRRREREGRTRYDPHKAEIQDFWLHFKWIFLMPAGVIFLACAIPLAMAAIFNPSGLS